jgi:urease accessory protein
MGRRAREANVMRGFAIRRAGIWDPAAAVDRVVLDAGDRHRRRIVLKSERGMEFLLDLDEAVALRDGDGIVLDDGTTVLVTGVPEPLVAIAARKPIDLVRLAWHLGNRHTDVQIAGDGLRIRRDHVLEEMLRGLGASVTPVEAPFDPEAGAPGHHHGHDHHHGHEHGS